MLRHWFHSKKSHLNHRILLINLYTSKGAPFPFRTQYSGMFRTNSRGVHTTCKYQVWKKPVSGTQTSNLV